jgi:hypothetical protein
VTNTFLNQQIKIILLGYKFPMPPHITTNTNQLRRFQLYFNINSFLERTNNNSVNLDIHFKSKFKTVSYYISSHLFFSFLSSPIPLLCQFSRSHIFLPISTRWVRVSFYQFSQLLCLCSPFQFPLFVLYFNLLQFSSCFDLSYN